MSAPRRSRPLPNGFQPAAPTREEARDVVKAALRSAVRELQVAIRYLELRLADVDGVSSAPAGDRP